ncbi:MAG: cell division protein ZapE [Gallionella sp.]|nr:cell division protein ZapE [Gallionella sp.]
MSPKQWYQDACDSADFVCDAAQAAAICELDALWGQLVEFKQKRNQFLGRSLLSPNVPKGLYIWGGVGRGKTFLMDGFYHCLPYRRKRRLHFHHFMSEMHHEMKRLSHMPDPLIALADSIAQSTRLLCLDELHVDDIADAMILGRLLSALFKRGVVLLTTSNYPPEGLYPNGLQRENFLPAIAELRQELKVLHFDGGRDYRLLNQQREAVLISSDQSERRMKSMFEHFEPQPRLAFVESGHLQSKQEASDAVWFDFKELCGGNHDQSDYLEIARRYSAVFLSDVPRMSAGNAGCARRFTWLIDVLYDNRVKLVASFDVAPDQLYEVGGQDSARIVSRLAEMQTRRYLELPHQRHPAKLSASAE